MHYTLFTTAYHSHTLLVSMNGRPPLPRSEAGYDCLYGLAAFLRMWAYHLAHGVPFHGRAWAIRFPRNPADAGMARGHRISLELLRVIHRGGHCFDKFAAIVGKHHQVIHRTLVRVG